MAPSPMLRLAPQQGLETAAALQIKQQQLLVAHHDNIDLFALFQYYPPAPTEPQQRIPQQWTQPPRLLLHHRRLQLQALQHVSYAFWDHAGTDTRTQNKVAT